jgi:hypothetical protein
MTITDIPSSVERIWNFLVPPLVELTILIAVTIFLAGYAPVRSTFVSFALAAKNVFGDPELIRILDAYGVTKLAPFVLLFLLFFVAHTVHKVAYLVGGRVPIHVSWNWYVAFIRNTSSYQIADIWQHYPRVSNVADLDRLIDEKVQGAALDGKDSVFRNALVHRTAFYKIHSYLAFVKFLLVWGLGLSILRIATSNSIKSIAPRLVFFVALLSLVFALIVRKLVAVMEFYGSAKIIAFRTWLHGSAEPVAIPDASRYREFEKNADEQLKSVREHSACRYFIFMKSLSAQRKRRDVTDKLVERS